LLPRITSIIPRGPTNFNFASFQLTARLGSVTIATCTAIGEPIPFVEWVKHGKPLTGGLVSTFVRSNTSTFVAAHLTVNGTVSSSDDGKYACFVEQDETNLGDDLSLKLKFLPPQEIHSPFECSLPKNNLTTLHIKFKVHTNCVYWTRFRLRSLAMALESTANGLCTNNCPFPADTITIREGPNCSTGAAIFKAEITAATLVQTREIFCALEEWQQSGSVITTGGHGFRMVDPNYALRPPGKDMPK